MCLLTIVYRTSASAPIMVAANREEFFNRPSSPPEIHDGAPRVLCGTDLRAGGTWLGVNEHGLVVAVTNRLKATLPAAPRSRGVLCRELLKCKSASEAAERAVRELQTGQYAGANYVCLDFSNGYVVHGGDVLRAIALDPGVHLITNADLDDPLDRRQKYVRRLLAPRFPRDAAAFLAAMRAILPQGPDATTGETVLVRFDNRGTVSSSILALTRRAEEAVLQVASGSPDCTPYVDQSDLLRKVLSRPVA